MARFPESKDLARAVRRHTERGVGVFGQKIVKATVKTVDPLAVELLGHDVTIESEHLLPGTWVRMYDAQFGIAVDDTVLLSQLADGDWFVIDVVSQDDLELGLHPELAAAEVVNTGSGHTVKKIPFHDEDGNLIGVVLVYDPATLTDFTGHTTAAGSGAAVVPN